MKLTLSKSFQKRFQTSILLIFIVFAGSRAVGQNEYHLFKYYEPFKPDSTGKFYFAVDNVNFFKNNENKLERSADYTITGALLRPKVVYYADPKLRLEFGAHVLKYNGRDDYAHILPWFNVHYQPNDKIVVILGNLDSEQGHLLPEQLYNPELFYTANPEAGLQAKYNSKRFSTDLWIDWQQMILTGDPFKERFAFGARTNLIILNNNGSSLSFPFTFYGLHEGGTIGTAPGLAKSFLTITPGLIFKKNISSEIFTDFGFNTSFSLSTYPKDNVIFKQSGGWGFFASGTVDSKFGALTAAFWHGHLFYTPQGTPIFQNYPGIATNWLTDHKIIDLKYTYQYQIIKNTYFGFMFDYYYDTIRRKAVNSEGLYLIVNLNILTRKGKNNQ
ncbi:MAG: hypothetical protein WCL21_14015 [Mariniphaga sp.]